MDILISFQKAEYEGVLRFLENDNQRRKLFEKTLAQAGVEYANYTKKLYLTRGHPLHVRTGRLRNSFGDKNSPYGVWRYENTDPYSAAVFVGTSVKYAAILNYGGDIYPKKAGGALAIPIGDALTPSGAPRFFWRTRGDIPKQYPELFPIKSKRGNTILVAKQGKQLRPYFVLVKHVKIPKIMWLQKSVEAFRPKFEKIVENWLAKYGTIK